MKLKWVTHSELSYGIPVSLMSRPAGLQQAYRVTLVTDRNTNGAPERVYRVTGPDKFSAQMGTQRDCRRLAQAHCDLRLG